MKTSYRNFVSTSIATLALGLSFAATANDTDTFNVTAEVVGVCEITAGNALAFGQYNPVTGDAVDGSTTISVTCADGMTGTDVGLAYTGAMSDGGDNSLDYGLFQDSARETVWTDTGEADRQSVAADGTAQEMTVFGRIDAGQTTAIVGNYSETVTATVYF